MLFAGNWFTASNGVTCPLIDARVTAADGSRVDESFLIDTGADRTVLTAELLRTLGFHPGASAPASTLSGLGGS
jgi:predicted aspartyl protease